MATQPGPWEDFQQPSVAPVERRGRPRLPPAQTATQQALEEERLRAARIQTELDALRANTARRTAADPAGDAPQAQRRDAGFYLRALRANEMYGGHEVAPRGVIAQTFADAFPRAANAMTDAERQQAEALQRDFIGATLRYESGAAIPPSEFESQSRIYFPQPGDTPETIALKATLRQNAIEALQRSAGTAAGGIDPAPAPVDLGSDTGIVPTGARNLTQQGMAVVQPTAGPTVTDPNDGPRSQAIVGDGNQELAGVMAPGERYTTEQDRALRDGFADRYNAGWTREQMQQWLNEAYPGAQISDEQWRAMEDARRNRRDVDVVPGASGVRTPAEVAASIISPQGADDAFVANALDSASLGLPGLFSEGYRNRLADVRTRNPVASIAGSIVGGIAAPGGPRPGMGLGVQSARSAFQGGAYGFNSTGGDPASAFIGTTIGAAAPGAFNIAGRGVRATRSAFSPVARNLNDPDAMALAVAAADENVRISRPIVDPRSRDRMAYLEASRGTGNIVREGLEGTRADIEARAGQLGAGGTAEDAGVMGQRIQDAGTRYIRESGQRATRMYDQAAQLAGDTTVLASDAVAEIDNQLARLQRNPNSNAGEITFLQGLRRDFVDEQGNLIPKTVADVRDIRTGLRGRIGEHNLTYSQVEGRVAGILDHARGDIERDLGGEASEAVRAYRAADRFYAERQDEIRNVVQRVIGRRDANLPGEQVMARIRTMAGDKGDSARLRRLWSHLDPEEQLDAAATIAETAGRRSADEPFTAGRFIEWARTLSPEARRTVFGPEGARSITNLNRLSKALVDTTSRLNNSRSGVVRNWGNMLREITGGGGAGVAISALGGGSALTTGLTGATLATGAAVTGMGLRRLSARSLMSNDMSRWLAAAGRETTPAGIRSHIDHLQVLARTQRNPAVAQEMLGLRQTLLNAVNDNVPLAAVASEREGQDNQ